MLDKTIGNIRFVNHKPTSALHRWTFIEYAPAVGKTGWRLMFSSAFWGWKIRFVKCGDGSRPVPSSIRW